MMIKQFKNYLGVGLINFFVCIASMQILAFAGVNYLIYTAVGYGFAICCSFFLNLRYTFTESCFSHHRMAKFFVASITNLAIVELIEYTLISSLNIRELYAVVIGMAWYTLTGFVVNKFYVYADPIHKQKHV